jgi:3-methylcrotonyl-CoA carboxylase beta subunit
MSKLISQLSTSSSEFKENFNHYSQIMNDFDNLHSKIMEGGGVKNVERHKSRGKLTARERIHALIDPGTDFFEFSEFAGFQVYQDDVPSAGIVTGIGIIHKTSCIIIANDATVKGGTYYPLTVKKHLRAQEIAKENKLPCIYLVDSGGAFLPMQDEVFPDRDHFGRIFFNQAQLSQMGIPQISAVMGSCTAGGAYIPAMSDQTIIVKGNGTIFLGGPPLVKAATGEIVTPEDLGGAQVHTQTSGVADYFANDDQHAIAILRNIIQNLNYKTQSPVSFVNPLYSADEILGILPKDNRKSSDPREILCRILDGSEFDEFKKLYATTIITGFGRIFGHLVGVIANHGVLFSESALKATHFIELCNQRGIPLLFLQNITGFMVGKKYENSGIAKDGAKMVHAVSCSVVPKYTLVFGGSYGAGNYGMCGRAFSPRFLWMWPHSRISVMGGEQAANVLATVKREQIEKESKSWSSEEELKFKEPILRDYETKSSAYFSSARLWDDGILKPTNTRSYLGMALGIQSGEIHPDPKYGIFRM